MITEVQRQILTRNTSQVPVKLGTLAADLGLEVFKSTLKPEISGLIEPSNSAPSGFQIKINRFEKTERQRFTLAHEIAHFLLHRYDIGAGLVDDAMYRSSLSSRKEVEANKLASEIIMPSVQIVKERNALSHLPIDELVEELAKKFRVSQSAMRIKLGV